MTLSMNGSPTPNIIVVLNTREHYIQDMVKLTPVVGNRGS
jgi:hypothetical protein